MTLSVGYPPPAKPTRVFTLVMSEAEADALRKLIGITNSHSRKNRLLMSQEQNNFCEQLRVEIAAKLREDDDEDSDLE